MQPSNDYVLRCGSQKKSSLPLAVILPWLAIYSVLMKLSNSAPGYEASCGIYHMYTTFSTHFLKGEPFFVASVANYTMRHLIVIQLHNCSAHENGYSRPCLLSSDAQDYRR